MTGATKAVTAAPQGIATGHIARAISGPTELSILDALRHCGCKFLSRDDAGQHQEIQLGAGLRKVARRGTYCAMHLEREAANLAAALSPDGLDSAAIDRINLYISPPGSGTPMHFDMRWIVVVQLAGSKLWQVGAGPAVDNPTSNVVADELAGMADYHGNFLALPDRMLFVLLRPGDWLMVPWATWHGTYSQNGSVSATLAFAEGATPDFPADFATQGASALTEGPRLLC
jgi:hypothetical protein